MTTALVTGGTGFVGSHLVEALLARGVSVRCLVRSPRRLRWLAGKDVEILEGDCRDSGVLDQAVRAVDHVYHVAGVMWGATEAAYVRANVDGTRNLIEACGRSAPGISRFVLVSSQAASGPTPGDRHRTESDPPAPITPYGRSKLRAEEVVLAHKSSIPVAIVRPCAVYGPRDTAFLVYFRIARRGFLIEFGRGEDRIVSLCHVSDVVEGIVQAACSAAVTSGSVYFLADSAPYRWREVEDIIEQVMGIRARRLNLPSWLLTGLGALGQGYSRATGKSVMLTTSRVAEMTARRWGCDASKAGRELEFAPAMNLSDGLRDVVRWYQKEQWL